MGVELTLIPSERRLALAGGNSGGIPLWERVTPLGQPTGELVHCHLGVQGMRPPAEPASGRVACHWRKEGDPIEALYGVRGVPREGIECLGFEPTERQLVVWSADGLLESAKVTVFERIELA